MFVGLQENNKNMSIAGTTINHEWTKVQKRYDALGLAIDISQPEDNKVSVVRNIIVFNLLLPDQTLQIRRTYIWSCSRSQVQICEQPLATGKFNFISKYASVQIQLLKKQQDFCGRGSPQIRILSNKNSYGARADDVSHGRYLYNGMSREDSVESAKCTSHVSSLGVQSCSV